MSLKVDTREVSELAEKMNTASNVLENDLHTVTQQLDELIALDSFSGAAATNAKNYFETFHKTAIESIQLIAKQLSANIHTHIDTFKADVDSHESARIDYNYLQEVKENVQTVHDNVEESVGHIADTLEGISDIVAIDPPSMIELETEKNNMVKSIDVLTNNVELFTEKGADHDDEMKEMLHHLETMINEASSSTGESRFTTIESANMINSLAFLGEANQLLENRQEEEKPVVSQKWFQDANATLAKKELNFVKYEQKPNFLVSSAELLFDVVKGGSKGVYHFAEDFVLGVIEMIEDPVAALEALATMVFNPIDTGYYLGKMIFESFVRDVIHGDAESRAHWFVYASSTVLGPKAVKQVGKKVDSKAKAGAQKAEQQLDDLLPYHQKHQVALVGPVPYNVLNGGFFVDRLIMMVERLPGSLGGVRVGGKPTSKIFKNGTQTFKKFDVSNAFVKPKHLSTTDGNGAKFLGNTKGEAEEILRQAIRKGDISEVLDNGLTRQGNKSYEIIINADKQVGTRGEQRIKMILSDDGGMLSAYPIK